ncbi:hypothetical protein DFH11DRAFT_1617984 [Phellopilus nigrolimitatus]|nr:hypothetical protein DFH11DRAFT_1617984 [Phellopilus nigrolimitatus]
MSELLPPSYKQFVCMLLGHFDTLAAILLHLPGQTACQHCQVPKCYLKTFEKLAAAEPLAPLVSGRPCLPALSPAPSLFTAPHRAAHINLHRTGQDTGLGYGRLVNPSGYIAQQWLYMYSSIDSTPTVQT